MIRPLLLGTMLLAAAVPATGANRTAPITPARLDAVVSSAMARTKARGLAVAVIDSGRVRIVRAYGTRNGAGAPLTTETIMYGASLTKMVFATMVMQLVDEDKLELDRSIATLLPKPLPDYADGEEKYADWRPLAGDERWRRITPRMLLTHSAGFANFGFLEPDGKLRVHFTPGSRYAYSGDGMILLQFVIERGLGLDVGAEVQRRVFDRFEMRRSSLHWRPDFAANLADGWDSEGQPQPHDERGRVRAAGSMDSTIGDVARFAAAFVRGQATSARSRRAMVAPQLAITTRSQFPTLQPEAPRADRIAGLAAGLGLVRFDGPQCAGFYKGGHDDITGNTLVCLQRRRRCVVIMANDVRAEAGFPAIVRAVLGETGMPWRSEYGPKEWAR